MSFTSPDSIFIDGRSESMGAQTVVRGEVVTHCRALRIEDVDTSVRAGVLFAIAQNTVVGDQ
jgi:hypothetical protein